MNFFSGLFDKYKLQIRYTFKKYTLSMNKLVLTHKNNNKDLVRVKRLFFFSNDEYSVLNGLRGRDETFSGQ
jgi:hypothetical protein